MKNKETNIIAILTIVLLTAAFIVIAIPLVDKALNKTNTNLYCANIATLENAAVSWGVDNYTAISADATNPSKVQISTLVTDYIKGNADNYYTNPIDKTSIKDSYAKVYLVDGVVNASIDTGNTCK